jgi:hypothetical protein
MKTKFKLVFGLLTLTASLAQASDSWLVRPGADLSYMNSSGFHRFLTDAYSDVSGGYGWVGVDAGLWIRLNEHLKVQPKITGYFNSIDEQDYYGNRQGTADSSMVIPGLALKSVLYTSPSGSIELGLNGDVGVPSFNTDLPGVSFKRDGPELGFSGSLRLRKSVDIQIGYTYIPVKVTPDPYSFLRSHLSETEKYNFGGIFVSIGYYF